MVNGTRPPVRGWEGWYGDDESIIRLFSSRPNIPVSGRFVNEKRKV
jgi:hypothetical protein